MNNLFIKRIKAFSLCCLRFNQFFRAALLFNPFVTPPPRDCIIDHTYLSISIYIFPIYIYNLSSSTLCIFFFFYFIKPKLKIFEIPFDPFDPVSHPFLPSFPLSSFLPRVNYLADIAGYRILR